MEDKTLEMTLLFDFFGELLTEKQRECFDLYYNEDLSLAEIAENSGITRQGVRDLLVRSEHLLRETERKTGLVRRFEELQAQVLSIESDLAQLRPLCSDTQCQPLLDRIDEKLQNLKG